jgi:hypothetical protein
MKTMSQWNLRIVNNCLFIDEVDSERVVLQHNARTGLRPYIHPLRGPDGVACLTEDSPGHHPWQHGIQTGFHGVNGCEFWEDPGQRPGKSIGNIEPRAPRVVSDNPPGWVVESVWRHFDGGFLLAERQNWFLRPEGRELYLDLDWRLQAIPDVKIVQHPYGGFFVRMPYREVSGASVLNSAGMADDDCEQQRAAWVDLFMPLERSEEGGGITVCDHPKNPGHPAFWRVDRNRGINPSPCIAGEIELSSGETLRHRYRLVLHMGRLSPEDLAKHWDRYVEQS